MREIKFRLWNAQTHSYETDCELGRGHIGSAGDVIGRSGEQATLTLEPHDLGAVWEQYTGLGDKRDKEIYEGDIVSLKIGTNRVVALVEYDDHLARFAKKRYSSYPNLSGDYVDLSSYLRSTEVIGNIHKNPGLLGLMSKKEGEA
jgi:hypothetical protein